MTLTTIKKAAKLMGYKVFDNTCDEGIFVGETGEGDLELFNPLTNKADLMDLECAFASLHMNILPSRIEFWGVIGHEHAETVVYIDDHPNKFTARAHAVMAVVEQIYDRREG